MLKNKFSLVAIAFTMATSISVAIPSTANAGINGQQVRILAGQYLPDSQGVAHPIMQSITVSGYNQNGKYTAWSWNNRQSRPTSYTDAFYSYQDNIVQVSTNNSWWVGDVKIYVVFENGSARSCLAYVPKFQLSNWTNVMCSSQSPFKPTGNPPSAGFSMASYSITIAWRDSSTNEDGYRLEYRPKTSSVWTQKNFDALYGTSHQYTINNLKPNTDYVVRVCAFNNGGNVCSREYYPKTSR